MKRIIIEKIIIYIVTFIALFTIASKDDNKYNDTKETFINTINSKMEKCNYVNTSNTNYNHTTELRYKKEDNEIYYELHTKKDSAKITIFRAELNLTLNENLNDTYTFLENLYDEDFSQYDREINNLINKFISTGDEQTYQDLNADRQNTIRIEKSSSNGKDYKLYFRAIVF